MLTAEMKLNHVVPSHFPIVGNLSPSVQTSVSSATTVVPLVKLGLYNGHFNAGKLQLMVKLPHNQKLMIQRLFSMIWKDWSLMMITLLHGTLHQLCGSHHYPDSKTDGSSRQKMNHGLLRTKSEITIADSNSNAEPHSTMMVLRDAALNGQIPTTKDAWK